MCETIFYGILLSKGVSFSLIKGQHTPFTIYMKLVIQSTLLELTDALREYVHRRLDPIAKVLISFEARGECTLRIEIARTTRHHRKGDVYYVEATMVLPRKTIRIEQYDEDIRAGIDVLRKRLHVSIEQYKERMEDKERGSRQK